MKERIKQTNVIELWANNYPEVTVHWLPKLQRKAAPAFDLYRYCQWAKLTPPELLALKENPASREAEKLLDRFVAQPIEGLTNSVQFRISTSVKSFFKHNYRDLARASGIMTLEKVHPYRKPTKEGLYKLWQWANNPRDRSLISLPNCSGIAKESLIKLKWRHFEEGWENIETPFINLPPEIIKGHGRGRYKGVRQITFLTPESKKDLIAWKEWIEQRLNRKVAKDDEVYREIHVPYKSLSYRRLGNIVWELSRNSGVPFGLHDARRFVEDGLESANIHPNRCKVIRGRKVPNSERAYSRPGIEELRAEYRKAIPFLVFIEKPSVTSISREDLISELPDEVLAPIAERKGLSLAEVRRIMVRKARGRPERKITGVSKVKRKETRPNGGNPINCQKIVGEDKLKDLLAQGWQVKAVLPSGKIVISLG